MKFFKTKQTIFRWVKGTELVELDDIDVSEDPVRPRTYTWLENIPTVLRYMV